MICKDCFQAHCFGVEECFVAQRGERSVGMDDRYSFADHDVAKDGEEGEDRWKCRFSLHSVNSWKGKTGGGSGGGGGGEARIRREMEPCIPAHNQVWVLS